MIWPDDFLDKVICGDSRELLKLIHDKAIDVVLTDPVWWGSSVDIPGRDEADTLFASVCPDLARLSDRLMIHLGISTDPRVLKAIPDTHPFVQLCWLRWIPPHHRGPVLVCGDVCYVYGHNRLPGDGSRVRGAEVTATYRPNKRFCASADPENPHPCPRSIDHVSWLVNRFSRPGDIILDPFCGAGTTCVAAKLADRHYIGIEIDQAYCHYARARVANTTTMFTPKEKKPKQSEEGLLL